MPAERLLLAAFAFGISLFGVRIAGSPVLVSDVALAATLLYFAPQASRLTGGVPSLAAIVLLATGAFSGVAHLLLSTPHFSVTEFLLSYARLLAGASVLLLVPAGMSHARITPKAVAYALLLTVRVHAIVLVLVELALLGFGFDAARQLHLPSVRQTDWGLEVRRASGLFVEPSYFAVYVALCVFTIGMVERSTGRSIVSLADLALLGLAVFLSTSLTAFVVLGVAIAVRSALRLRYARSSSWVLLAALVSLASAAVLAFQSDSGQKAADYLSDRIVSIGLGGDSSLNDRVLGSLEIAFLAVDRHPFIGVGLGQEQSFIARNENVFRHKAAFDREGHIAWLNVLTTMGLAAAAAYLLLLAYFIANRQRRVFGVGVILTSFAFGGFLSALVWWFIAVAMGIEAIQTSRPSSHAKEGA